MSDDKGLSDLDGRLDRLRYSITNLWDELGRTDSIGVGVVVNLFLAGMGVLVYLFFSGWIAFAGGVWAILHIIALIKWVLGL